MVIVESWRPKYEEEDESGYAGPRNRLTFEDYVQERKVLQGVADDMKFIDAPLHQILVRDLETLHQQNPDHHEAFSKEHEGNVNVGDESR
jgi:hypothetical protein